MTYTRYRLAEDLNLNIPEGETEEELAFRELEIERIDRWHETYNAALTGLCTRMANSLTWCIEQAEKAADETHGPLAVVEVEHGQE